MLIKILSPVLFGWILINVILIMVVCVLEITAIFYRKNLGLPTLSDDGQIRYIKLGEYRINRKRKIRTDSSYWLYENIKGTSMENREVDFNIDGNGFIEPSGNLNCLYKFAWSGDSTTECAIVSPNVRFPYLTEEKLRADGYDVASFNDGYSGKNLFEINISLLCKLLPLKPTHIFVCTNINDIRALSANNYVDAFIQKSHIILDSDISSTLPNRIKKAARICVPNLYTMMYQKKHKNQAIYKPPTDAIHIDMAELGARIERIIRGNYKILLAICNNNSIKPIFMTQASMFDVENKKLLNIYYKQIIGETGLSYQDFKILFHSVNNVIRSIAKENDILLIDLEREIPLDERYIYDLVHYTEEGSRLVANIIYEHRHEILS